MLKRASVEGRPLLLCVALASDKLDEGEENQDDR